MTPGSRAVYSCSYAFAHSLRGIMNSSMKRRSQVIGLFVLALLTAVPVLAQNAPQPGGETPLLPAGVPPLPFEITQHEPIDTQDDGFSSAIPIACGAGGFGTIGAAYDTDYWQFILPTQKPVVARVFAMEGGSQLDATLRLYVNLGGNVEVAYSDDFDGRDPRLHHAGYPTPSYAYLQVRDHGHNDGSAGHWYVVIWDHPTYVSAKTAGTVNGFSYAPGDVLVHYECSDTWEMFFDASDVGLSLNTSGFAMYPNTQSGRFLLTFAGKGNVPQVGTVLPHDVVEFIAGDVGTDTAGVFRLFLDGSDVGLSTSGEKLDGIALDKDGEILLSTAGNGNVPGLGAFADEDVIRLDAGSYSAATTGTWSMAFDGSDVGLGGTDINSVWQSRSLTVDGYPLYFSVLNNVGLVGLAFDDDDIAVCDWLTYGPNTSCGSWSKVMNLAFLGTVDALDRGDARVPDKYTLAGGVIEGAPIDLSTSVEKVDAVAPDYSANGEATEQNIVFVNPNSD